MKIFCCPTKSSMCVCHPCLVGAHKYDAMCHVTQRSICFPVQHLIAGEGGCQGFSAPFSFGHLRTKVQLSWWRYITTKSSNYQNDEQRSNMRKVQRLVCGSPSMCFFPWWFLLPSGRPQELQGYTPWERAFAKGGGDEATIAGEQGVFDLPGRRVQQQLAKGIYTYNTC